MDEKKVELTDEEIAEEIVKALVNTKKTLKDLHEDDDDYDKLSLIKKINNSSLWLIQRLQDENAEQKAEIERLKKGQAESAKTAVEVLEQNIELQKQVEYWESETKIARRDIDEAVKDTAKEIYLRVKNKSGAELSFLNDLALWIKERFGVAVEKWISKLN